ncbi:2-oxoacid:acceptor oxidoreductase family protein [Methanococcus aeolicus]|uniref:Pyruvate/ketoisovalerate oxidoreductase, gamma subunit n=1 Tax=Methanococcus aeolicus (strain ATCC BAA-1280 / DSM 17508 / OCM 812 / Nankai-3) TaxID=419665 RepID=A6UU91_META3|nr:2-oxoacid:acceptor oxidoreductase family protein [Methanococcus aeolicus]ABR56063.1 pyruvate/ketoisovalerate oxidoreductase, gamma subunit [Methanococcus aeolicus Nankai-3]UXM85332.1 2-oxoacid:acceptor oxidoreductase family protein [Methanococcus aeolicus]
MRKEIRFAGFGGQGILLSGIILGRAAALYENNYAFQTQSIGPEARGGISRAEVVISDNSKDYPKVRNLDVLVAMSQESLDIYIRDLKSGKILIYDPDMMNNFPNRKDINIYPIPATQMAYDIGNKIVANVVMLGALVSITNTISKESLKNAVFDVVPPKFKELNLKALEKGFELGHK